MKWIKRFWPVTHYITALIILMGVMSVFARFIEDKTKLFAVLLTITLFSAAAAVLLNERLRNDVRSFLIRVTEGLEPAQRTALDNLPSSVAVVSKKGELIWYNEHFRENILCGVDFNGGQMTALIADFRMEAMKKGESFHLNWGEKWFDCVPSAIDGEGEYIVYFNDITELKMTEEKYLKGRPTVMMIVFDNEEELLKARESERVRVFSEVDALINRWADQSAGICWANVRDKSLIVMEESQASRLINEKFSILEEAKSISVEDGTSVTLSIGVGRAGSSIEECEKWALEALDMALGRGGDQAVVRSPEGFGFFGGALKSSERQSKVRMRMLANSLAEHIQHADNCIIMGHRYSDLDAIGSAIGVYAIARSLGKRAYIAVDEETSLAKSLIKHYKKSLNGAECFMALTDALDYMRDNTLLVVVDTHSPDFVESRALYERAQNVAVIDHHRLMVNHIDNTKVMIHEAYASSASEIVAELAGYIGEKAIGRTEAEALLSGIMLDTKNYVLRTGVRTFEASAFLKKRGADTVDVKRLFSESLNTYTARMRLAAAADIYKNCAIACASEYTEDMRIASSQAADDLLTINDINASFVLFESNGCINISGRSLGRVNVQLIMEQLGGGGHLTMAGAQPEGISMEEALTRLKAAIDKTVK